MGTGNFFWLSGITITQDLRSVLVSLILTEVHFCLPWVGHAKWTGALAHASHLVNFVSAQRSPMFCVQRKPWPKLGWNLLNVDVNLFLRLPCSLTTFPPPISSLLTTLFIPWPIPLSYPVLLPHFLYPFFPDLFCPYCGPLSSLILLLLPLLSSPSYLSPSHPSFPSLSYFLVIVVLLSQSGRNKIALLSF